MIQEQINKSLISAMKEKNVLKVSTLRMVNSAIKDKEITLRTEREDTKLLDGEVISLLKSLVKSRENSIVEYKKANREEYAQKEQDEIDIIKEFLPEEYSEAELLSIVKQEVEKSEDKTMKALKIIIANIQAREDVAKINMGLVAKIAKELLNN
ncbi:GatB/YqeY domain-containing protein [Rickettsiales bacterium LUAb2]